MSRTSIAGLFLVTFVTACGGREPTETDPSLPYPTEADFCDALAEAECSQKVVEVCYGSDSTTLAEDKAACRAARKEKCNPDALPYHPEKAEDCLLARQQGVADTVWTRDELEKVRLACLPVFSKEGPEGAACTADHDCDTGSDLRCIVKLGSFEGVCGAAKPVSGGEDCSDPLATCKDGFYCDPDVSHCLANPVENQACSTTKPCAADFFCTSFEEGTCVAKTKNGGSCEADALCAGGFCVGMTHSTPGVCSATLPLTITSATCDLYR